MKTITKVGLVALAVAGLGIGAAAFAHGPGYGPGYGPGSGMGYGMHGPGGFGPGYGMRGPASAEDVQAWQESRLTSLKEALKITEAQQPAWAAFESAVRNEATAMIATREAMHSTRGNPETHAALMQSRLESMKTVLQARGELYKVLTAEQKAVLDNPASGCGFGGFGGQGRWRS